MGLRPYLLLVVILLTVKTTSAVWANNSYDKCKNVSIVNAGSPLENFPAYVNITYDSDMLTDYKDIIFYNQSCDNGGVTLSFENDSYTATNANFWVKIPMLNTGTTIISVYYKNNTKVVSLSNGNAVFNDTYGGVYHMNSVNATDSCGNNVVAAASAITITLNTSGGMVGNNLVYPGGSVRNNVGTGAAIALNNITNYTIESWVKMPNTANAIWFQQSQGSSSWNAVLGTYTLDVAGNAIKHTYRSQYDATRRSVNSVILLDNTWQYVVARYMSSPTSASENRSEIWVNANMSANLSFAAKTRSAAITATQFGYGGDYGSFPGGQLDEIRISKKTLSADWINETYQLMVYQATYVTFSGEMTNTFFRYSSNSTNSTWTSSNIMHSLFWDPGASILDSYIFSFCNGGWNGSTCNKSTYVYQENSSESQCASPEECDGNWSTYNNPFELFANYTKPAQAIGAMWQVESYAILPLNVLLNITIPNACWNAYPTKIVLWVEEAGGGPTPSFWCHNGTGYSNIYACAECNDNFAEEAIWWEYQWVNDSSVTFTSNWSNATKTSVSTIGDKTAWCVYANTTTGLWNDTSCSNPFTYTLTISDCIYSSGDWVIDDGDTCYHTTTRDLGSNKIRILNGKLRITTGILYAAGCFVQDITGGLFIGSSGNLHCGDN